MPAPPTPPPARATRPAIPRPQAATCAPPQGLPEPAPLWKQLASIGAMLTVSLAHFSAISWLFALPRYRREPFALRLCCDPWAWYVSRWFLRPLIRVIGEENLPKSWSGFLYASNHESLVDIVLLTKIVRRGFLMKRSVLLSPIGLGTYLSGSVSIDRASKRDREKALRDALAMAKQSMSIIVFPEGTFGHRDGRLRAPHLKLLRHAWRERLAVVPLGHAGSRRAVDGQSLPVRTEVPLVLVVRPALQPERFTDENAFAEACWNEVIAAVRQARAELPPGWPYESDPGASHTSDGD